MPGQKSKSEVDKIFCVEQYEINITTYDVQAKSAADAVDRTLDYDGLTFVKSRMSEVCNSLGMRTFENKDLTKELRKLGVVISGNFIPSIRKVYQKS